MINLILCGGSGTRLWPLSRTMMPKQFLRMFDGKSLFQKTVQRNQPTCSRSLVIANIEHYFLALDQLAMFDLKTPTFMLEPFGRNTAPAIALACMTLNKDEVVFVTSSDHIVKNQSAYEQAVLQARQFAEAGNLVTFGIQPEYPEIGFGYIEASGNDVVSFKEKPDAQTAQAYIDSGNYYWNSGMFCFKAGVFLDELQQHSPEVYDSCLKVSQDLEKDVLRIDISEQGMQSLPDISVDYAVMEHSKKVKVVPCDIGWSDVGSFDSLFNEFKGINESDEFDNMVVPRWDSSPKPIMIDSKDNLVMCRERQIAMVDVQDLMVVDTSDAILIANRNSSQKVKNVVAEIKKSRPELAQVHRLSYRPWGIYEVLLDADKYKVKRITVKPGGRLSLQKHFHRNEHWIVVSGTATVTVGDERMLVRPNESTYIKMGQWHRLENEGKIELVMMEVQVGEYTGEDDIVRTDDSYGR